MMISKEKNNRKKHIFIVGLAIVLIILSLHIYEYRFDCDDAYISYRYAVNFSEGHGLVFNVGERVEGYTNFLWVVILGFFSWLGLAPHLAALPISIILTFILLFFLIYYNKRFFGEQKYDYFLLLAPLVMILNRSFAVWSTSGLETRLFSLMIFLAAASLLSREFDRGGKYWVSALFFSLAALTRPEGILLFGTFYATVLIWRLIRRRPVRKLLWSSLIFVLIVGGHFLFRYLYYGYPFPNTFYAKVTGIWLDMGLLYLFVFIHEYGLYLPLIFLPVLLRSEYETQKRNLFVILVIAILPYLVYLSIIGGDHFEFRPLDVTLPFLALFIQEIIRNGYRYIRNKNQTWVRAAGIVLLILFGTFYILPGWYSHINFQSEYDAALGVQSSRNNFLEKIPGTGHYFRLFDFTHGKLAKSFICIRQEEHKMAIEQVFYPQGMSLKKLVDKGIIARDEIISLDCVGTLPYLCGLTTIDKLGLTDAYVAHKKLPEKRNRLMAHEKRADMRYLWERKVTYVATHPSRFFYPREVFFAEGKFLPEKMKKHLYIIPAGQEIFAFYSVYRLNHLGPRMVERGVEFYYIDENEKIHHIRP